jgi:putative heme iron utilization protein
LTLEAVAGRTADPAARARFLRRNPKSALYADFPDFSFWRLEITAVHLNGGFARAADFGPGALLTPTAGAESLIAEEEATLEQLNEHHAATLRLLARKSVGEGEAAWRASGLDPEGLDLVCGDAAARIVFLRPVSTPDELRAHLIQLSSAAQP